MNFQTMVVYVGLVTAVGALLSAICFFGYAVYRFLRSSATPFRVGWSRMLIFSVAVMFAVFGVRSATCSHRIILRAEGNGGPLLPFQTVGDGILHTLQTFSLDEDYEQSVNRGKNLVLDLSDGRIGTMAYAQDAFGKQQMIGYGSDFFNEKDSVSKAYGENAAKAAQAAGFLLTALNCAAPISGGAVIFEILAAVFPKLRLWLLKWCFWSKKIYFSELNDRSIELMKSIYEENTTILKRPVMIFTDAYASDGDERSSELLQEAKVYGAICVKDDLANVSKCTVGKRVYFLIDEEEEGNLKTLVDLSAPENGKAIRGAKIYVFAHNDDTYVQVERRVLALLLSRPIFKAAERKGKREKKNKRMPSIIPVQSHRNLVTNLFDSVPLYEPLVGREKGVRDLNLTILGCGGVGMETVLAAYWYGQILDCRLHVHVISKEDEESFNNRLDYVNPEIRRSTDPQDEILRYGTCGMSPAYCSLEYVKSDVTAKEFCAFGVEKTEQEGSARRIKSILEQTDYFVVALGNDEDNVAIAEKLRRYLAATHLKEEQPRNVVIAYAVYCSELAQTLNEQRCYSSKGTKPDIYMYAFGGLRQVYSTDNVLMTRHYVLRTGVGEAYSRLQRTVDLEYDHGTGRLPQKEKPGTLAYNERYDNAYYNYWANLARAFHMKYKVFSLGWITTSVFDDMNEEKSDHHKSVKEACARYKQVAEYRHLRRQKDLAVEEWSKAEDEEQKKALYEKLQQARKRLENAEQKKKEQGLEKAFADYERNKHKLAWLEHRRWVAFTRTRGFHNTDEAERYLAVTGDHKYMSLKLHPCLREYELQTGDAVPDDLFKQMEKRVNDARAKAGFDEKDFREYDYIIGEFPF